MIDLATIDGLDKAGIHALVTAEQTNKYEIYVPKSTEDVYTGPETVADDYALAAYAGQLLADVATAFSYEKVKPEQQKSIRFDVTCDDTEALVKALLQISYGYMNDHEDLNFNIFEDVFDYIDEVEDGNLKPACPYFIEVFVEYADMAETDDEGDDDED